MPEELKVKINTTNETNAENIALKFGKFVFANGDIYEGNYCVDSNVSVAFFLKLIK
jgi:hypothetical protein